MSAAGQKETYGGCRAISAVCLKADLFFQLYEKMKNCSCGHCLAILVWSTVSWLMGQMSAVIVAVARL